MTKDFLLSVLVVSLLSACAGIITVHSNPEGALISGNKQTLGVRLIELR